MRETLKSLSILSAMLLVFLLISTGCVVNIPGCGMRSLPFLKPAEKKPTPLSAPSLNLNLSPSSITPVANMVMVPSPATTIPVLKKSGTPQPTPKVPVEIPLTKPTPTVVLPPTPTTTPIEMEKIAYTTLEQGKTVLYTMNNDGTNRTRVTPPGVSCWHPLWSPSGKILAFLSDMEGGKINLFMVKKGDTHIQQLTSYQDMTISDPKSLKPPFSWSPRSDEIAYLYHRQLWKTNLSTSAEVSLATMDPAFEIVKVEWAPHRDNKFVAYLVRKGSASYSLGLVNPRLLDQLTISEVNSPILDISWSPDARKVAYIAKKFNVYTASADTTFPKVVIQNLSPGLGPLLSFSPLETSTAILVLAKKTSDETGYRVGVITQYAKTDQDLGAITFLTEPGVDDAVWSPDGSKIAYTQAGELWVMDASGGNKSRLAVTGIQFPSWSRK